MPRYFLEVFYKGTRYNGFQVQKNANSIQAEIEKVFEILLKKRINLTGSSRTDAGVHALQNYFHFDFDGEMNETFAYKLNAILPPDIVIKNVINVHPEAHCRFDAISREYKYFIYRYKDPFLSERAYYFPYQLDLPSMEEAAGIIKNYSDFTSFSKKKTQVKTFDCSITQSRWTWEGQCLVYHVAGNRFLRGMVRGLTGTMLNLGRNKISLVEFENILRSKDPASASFAVPAHGLFLIAVNFPEKYL